MLCAEVSGLRHTCELSRTLCLCLQRIYIEAIRTHCAFSVTRSCSDTLTIGCCSQASITQVIIICFTAFSHIRSVSWVSCLKAITWLLVCQEKTLVRRISLLLGHTHTRLELSLFICPFTRRGVKNVTLLEMALSLALSHIKGRPQLIK